MYVNDPIADMLTRIRNSLVSRKETVDIPTSKMKKQSLIYCLKKAISKALKWLM